MTRDSNDITDGFALRILPPPWRRFGLLIRLDRPIGWWLLLLPGWQAILLAGDNARMTAWLLVLFLVGAVITRGAGCIINDLWDRDIDGKVARTRTRPLASGEVSVKEAIILLAILSGIGLVILLALPAIAIITGLAALPLIVFYPYAKRIMAWPQLILALTFAWGAWLGWAATGNQPGGAAALLYMASACWAFGYDTIYAIQDMEDDRGLGIGSSALALARRGWLKPVVGVSYAGMLTGLLVLGRVIDAGIFWYCACAVAGVHLAWQIRAIDMDTPQKAGNIFRSNRDLGLVIAIGAALA